MACRAHRATAKGGKRPKKAEQNSIAKQIGERLDRIIPAGEAHTWFKIFKDMDEDGSGMLTFDEFASGMRERLNR